MIVPAWWAAAAAACVLVAAGALISVRHDDATAAQGAPIIASSGGEVGSVRLIDDPTPHILVTIESPRPDSGIRTCELRLADGRWVEVGWWDAQDIASGVWAVGIAPELLDATEMRINSGGTVLASATFD